MLCSWAAQQCWVGLWYAARRSRRNKQKHPRGSSACNSPGDGQRTTENMCDTMSSNEISQVSICFHSKQNVFRTCLPPVIIQTNGLMDARRTAHDAGRRGRWTQPEGSVRLTPHLIRQGHFSRLNRHQQFCSSDVKRTCWPHAHIITVN